MKSDAMQANNILTADILDIIFDERNKEYGAYDLRLHYRERLTKSLLAMFLIVVLLLITYYIIGSMKTSTGKNITVTDHFLKSVVTKTEKPVVIKPPVVKVEPPKIKTIAYTVPKIEKEPPENERPPEVKEVETAKIATVTNAGKEDDGSITAPVDERKGIVDGPKKQDDNDAPFTRVEIESQYPGGPAAWSVFLGRNCPYPDAALNNEIQGTVIIQFVVDVQGVVSDVMAISGPEELRAVAITAIKKSGRWTPGIQNGHPVKSYKKQPITFKLPEQ